MGGDRDLSGKRGVAGRSNRSGLPKTQRGSLGFRRTEEAGHEAFLSLDPDFPHLLRVNNALG